MIGESIIQLYSNTEIQNAVVKKFNISTTPYLNLFEHIFSWFVGDSFELRLLLKLAGRDELLFEFGLSFIDMLVVIITHKS